MYVYTYLCIYVYTGYDNNELAETSKIYLKINAHLDFSRKDLKKSKHSYSP